MTYRTSLNQSLAFHIIILAIMAFAARLIGLGLGHLPVGDEMFHILAAQSWVETGELAIADGFYNRAALYTQLVGVLFTFFGDSLSVARLPALVFGVLWVLLLFVWVDRRVGRLAAWLTSFLFLLAPHAIELSLYSRMYTLHGFLYLLGCIGIYDTVTRPRTLIQKSMLIFGAAMVFALALHLQKTTLIGLMAMMPALFVLLVVKNWSFFRNGKVLWITFVAIVLLLCAAAAIVYLKWDLLEPYFNKFITPTFAKQPEGARYYFKLLATSYPVLWLLLPFFAIVAFYFKPKFTAFCLTVFLVIFTFHSFAGPKAERYFYYGMPFLFAIWGTAIAKLLPYLNESLNQALARLFSGNPGHSTNLKRDLLLKTAALGVLIVFIIGGSGAFARTVNLFLGQSYYFGTKLSDWEAAIPTVQPYVQKSPFILTTNFPKVLYYFGRFDMTFSKVIVADILKGEEGGIDFRNGRPAISTLESLEKVFQDNPRGIFIAETSEWRNRFRMTNDGADFIEQNATRLVLPASARIIAFYWQSDE